MIEFIGRFLLKCRIKSQIRRLTAIIYSPDDNRVSRVEEAVLASNVSVFDLQCAWRTLKAVAEAEEPIDSQTISDLANSSLTIRKLKPTDALLSQIELDKLESLMSTQKREIALMLAATAYEADPESLEGMLYRAVMAKRGPLTLDERLDFIGHHARIQELLRLEKELEQGTADA